MKRFAPAVLVITAAMLSGCSPSTIVNTGGDTKCKDFVSQDEKKQSEEVSKMLKDKNGTEPASMEITATRASVKIFCQTVGKPDDKISEAPHG